MNKMVHELTGNDTTLYMYAPSVTAGLRWAPETIPKMLMIIITAKPKPSAVDRGVGGPCGVSTAPRHPINSSRPVPIHSARNTINKFKCECFMSVR